MQENSLLDNPNYYSFEKVVVNNFSFLENTFKFEFSGIREINDSPRDQGVVAKYLRGEEKIEIGWSANEGSLVILIKTIMEGLSRPEKHIYFEPFIEFISQGEIVPIVPQIYPGMSLGRIKKTMIEREKCFENGFINVLEALADKLEEFLPEIQSISVDKIKQYHKWYSNEAKLD